MAEIAAASSIVSLIDFSGKVLAAGYGFLAKVARAPTEIHTLLTDVANVNTLLAQMQSLADDLADPNTKTVLKSLSDRGVFQSCEILLKSAENYLDSCRQIDGNHLKNFGRALKWPLMEREMKDTMQQLRILQDQLTAALTVDSSATMRRIDDSTKKLNVLANTTKTNTDALLNHEHTRKLMHWVAPECIDPDESYESALKVRQSETGTWFLESVQFQEFLESEGGLFWLYGKPGSGKTILTSIIIEYLQPKYSEAADGLVYFFCKDQSLKQQILKTFMMVFITQLTKIQPSCMRAVEAARHKSDRSLTDTDYVDLIKDMLVYFRRVILVIDALDESVEVNKFSQFFEELLNPALITTKVLLLVTSREDVNVERLIAPLVESRLSLADKTKADIRMYVAAEVERRIRSRTLKLRDPRLATDIIHSLVDCADGLFLQAKVQLEYVCNFKSDGAIKAALRNLPSGLDDTYEQVLSDILQKTPAEAEIVRTILKWLFGSYYLLTPSELAEAVSIQPEDTFLDIEMIATDPEDLVALCRSLVVIDRSHDPPLVSLTHFTVKEYLRSDRLANSSASFFHMTESQVHLDLAVICTQYLAFRDFADTAPLATLATFDATALLIRRYVLLHYAAEHWAKHIKASKLCKDDFERAIRPRLQWFLQPDVDGHHYSSWQSVWYYGVPENEQWDFGCFHELPFYHAILLGLEPVFDILLPQVSSINDRFKDDWTPLTAALKMRRLGIARKLLDAGADPNIAAGKNRNALTPLHVAAENGLEDMAELLLNIGADPHARTITETTPMYRAARGGSLRIMQMLHELGCDVNARTWDNWTAIFDPVLRNRIDLLEQLLLWDADCNITTRQGVTPFSLALSLGREQIVQILADKTSPECQKARTTPLCGDEFDYRSFLTSQKALSPQEAV